MATPVEVRSVFSTAPLAAAPARFARLRPWLVRAADRVLGLTTLQGLYARCRARSEPHFVDRALAVLDVRCVVSGRTQDIPDRGPVVVVSNHPQGALDGLALLSVVLSRRRDVRVLGNHLLARIPEVATMLVPVDVVGGAAARPANASALREALRWLRGGGCLCVFPAGEVAHRGWGLRAGEGPWHRSVHWLATRSGASRVRCTIDGDNGWLFRIAGRVHPRLRTALLPRMLLAKRATTVRLRVEPPIAAEAPPRAPAIRRDDAVVREIAPALASRTLVQQGALRVCWVHGARVPALLEDIGRARERAFREVGEGTGQEIDLDEFDRAYLHLCLWDEQRQALAGAYRMGLADELSHDGRPLYTQTLFDYDPPWFSTLGPSIELGRAFLAAAYRSQFAPLALLWTAIGRFVADRPHYRSLFGAVSIDTAYGPAARHAMVTYLQQHAAAPQLSALVTPRHPVTADTLDDGRLAWAGSFKAPDVAVLDDVVARLDAQGRGVPVLLRQYLKLDARAVAFGIDPDFSHVLDALIVVDLPTTPSAMLRRFMGPEPAAAYLAAHGQDGKRRAASPAPRRRA